MTEKQNTQKIYSGLKQNWKWCVKGEIKILFLRSMKRSHKALPDSSTYFFNYGLEMYQYASDTTSGKRPANSDELVKKAQEKLSKSLAIET